MTIGLDGKGHCAPEVRPKGATNKRAVTTTQPRPSAPEGTGRRGPSDVVLLGVLWIVFTLIGEYLAFGVDLLPGAYAREAHVVDEAYRLLIGLAVPVFAGVAAALLTMMLRHTIWDSTIRDGADGGHGATLEDGPHTPTHRTLVPVWLGVSAVLAVGVSINPGFVGLSDLRGSSQADLVVAIQAQRWSWKFTYPNGGVSTTELVLPVDKRVRFDLSSIDVVHSFWVPAFRQKLDAVPGRVTKLYLTPEREGDFASNFNLRLQCAELCGLDHAKMAAPVRVVPAAEFDAWLSTLGKGA